MDFKQDLAQRLTTLRTIEGFPVGTDADIIALSQPPFYTACPNPYINDFIEEYGTPYNEETDTYHREPYAGDVSEGRNDPMLNAHFYHTKVPPKAIEKYIKHYTDEGDLILDGFCGTGTTGIASNNVKRKAILSDLSPIAAFIAYNQTNKFNGVKLVENTFTIIEKLKKDISWLYQTNHTTNTGEVIKCNIDYTIWSDIFCCPYCKHEYNYWDKAVDFEGDTIKNEYKCDNCDASLTKNSSEKVFERVKDEILGFEVEKVKQVPVIIAYTFKKKKHNKTPDELDIETIEKITKYQIPYWIPSNLMMFKGVSFGDLWRAGYHKGLTHSHHFYTKRNLILLSSFYHLISLVSDDRQKQVLLFLFTSLYSRSHRMNRYIPEHGRHVGPLSGTLYVSFLQVEINVINIIEDKLKSISRISGLIKQNAIISNQSITALDKLIKPNTIDYIFTDPPFGDNLPYSELNFIMESWLKVITNNELEAIINDSQNKNLVAYRSLMETSFNIYYKLLKPNRWMTVVFHNSKSAVWVAIQEAIIKAGFIISNVAVLDKKKGTTKQLSYAGTVKSDLVISAYKPLESFTKRFLKQAGEQMETHFVNQFLDNLPVKPIVERTEKMLYSKMLAFYIQHGYEVRYDAKTFYKMLSDNFAAEDGLWFNANQINSYLEYKKRVQLEGIEDVKTGAAYFLFVSDEKSALAWLYVFLQTPKTFSDVSLAYNQIAQIQGDTVPDLREVLEDNFIVEGGAYRLPKTEQEHTDKTEKRERALMREFEGLLLQATTEKGRIKIVRKEALNHGFEICYKNKRYADILTLSKKLDKTILENDGDLRTMVEAAELMVEGF